jgi:predicted Zn finger-like uncharacterized protein
MLTKCPSCNKSLKVPDNAAGRKGKCPQCSTTFTLGDAEATASSEAALPILPTPAPAAQRNDDPLSQLQSQMSGAATSPSAPRGPSKVLSPQEFAAVKRADAERRRTGLIMLVAGIVLTVGTAIACMAYGITHMPSDPVHRMQFKNRVRLVGSAPFFGGLGLAGVGWAKMRGKKTGQK